MSSVTKYNVLASPRVVSLSKRNRDVIVGSRPAASCKSKVDRVRRQLAEGTYDVDKKLDAALGKLLQAIYA